MSTTATDEVVYLDHNATTPVAPEVLEAMLPYLRGELGNPSSDHGFGRRARQAVEEARASVAALIGARPDEIVFTSGGTESNNLAIRGVAAKAPSDRRRIVTSAVEHPATTAPLALLEGSGWMLTRVPVAASGILDLAASLAALGDDVALATVMLAHNETGALMPVAELAAAARAHRALVHTDAAQAIGKIPVSVEDLGVDLCSIAGHKLYAPKGVGALYVRRGTPLSPLVVGAGQEQGLRPGTENVAGIVGLGAACELARSRLAYDSPRLGALRDELLATLRAGVPGLVCHTPLGTALPNTLFVSFPGVHGTDLLARARGVAASTGSACHAGNESSSATLLAMGVAPDIALCALRLSLGRDTTATAIALAADHLVAAYHQARNEHPVPDASEREEASR